MQPHSTEGQQRIATPLPAERLGKGRRFFGTFFRCRKKVRADGQIPHDVPGRPPFQPSATIANFMPCGWPVYQPIRQQPTLLAIVHFFTQNPHPQRQLFFIIYRIRHMIYRWLHSTNKQFAHSAIAPELCTQKPEIYRYAPKNTRLQFQYKVGSKCAIFAQK